MSAAGKRVKIGNDSPFQKCYTVIALFCQNKGESMMAAKAKKQGSRKTAKKKNTETSFVGTEIFIWMTLAVSILLMISNFGFGGFVG